MGYEQKDNAITIVQMKDVCPFQGNLTINNVETLIDEIFKATPYIQIEGEERKYHFSERNELLAHIKELNEKTVVKKEGFRIDLTKKPLLIIPILLICTLIALLITQFLENPIPSGRKLVGTWERDLSSIRNGYKEVWHFGSDGSFRNSFESEHYSYYYQPSLPTVGEYKVRGNKIILKHDGVRDVYQYSLLHSNTTLIIGNEASGFKDFKRK